MTVPRAAIVYTVRCHEPGCDCVHVFFCDADEVVFAEAVMLPPQAEDVARHMLQLASEHAGRLQ